MAFPLRSALPEPHEDHGFFGPGSVCWRVWSYPTSLTVGFQRAVTIEELDPALVAAVDRSGNVRRRTATRYDRTLKYFALVAFGGTRETSRAADVLVKVHAKGIGIEPLSGNRYDANDPHSQLWIHLTAWHSILYAYERYGPGKLSAADELRYWEECARAAELQTCDPADVPRTREGIRAYFEEMRPKLAGSEVAQSMMDFLLDAKHMARGVPRGSGPIVWVVNEVLRRATIATMPRWMRKMAGLRQSRVVDALVRPVMRISLRAVAANARVELAFLKMLSPSTAPVVAPILLDVPPVRAETLTPAEARERYGYERPRDAHAAWRAKQRAKVFEEGAEATDEGLLESEPILGSIA